MKRTILYAFGDAYDENGSDKFRIQGFDNPSYPIVENKISELVDDYEGITVIEENEDEQFSERTWSYDKANEIEIMNGEEVVNGDEQ
ncbi:hypothetical protein HMPREF0863_00324 [Erysipelotrichaceae bacterium 5_2_54FAA]|nr:hypothetical protein HMPREF0863_00324 [Erysipelotrichaceae bacterium 5_2_54FAA]